MSTVRVTFRVWKGEVCAVLPDVPADYYGHMFTCYAHVGQHSSCSREWLGRTRRATPEEYGPLLAELTSIYAPEVLRVIQRITRRAVQP